MCLRIVVSLALFIILLPTAVLGQVTFTSLPNPNVYPIFILLEQGYLEGHFIPARGGVAGILALLQGEQADVAPLNREPAAVMAHKYGWQLLPSTIVKAIHLLSYQPVYMQEQIEHLDIVSAFPGGSPEVVYRVGGFTRQPTFLDPFLAVQLFLKKTYNALLLPEPLISQVAATLRERGELYHITDMHLMTQGAEQVPLNATVVRKGTDAALVQAALAKAITFINAHPQRAAAIIATAYEKAFGQHLSEAVILEALQSGRLLFASEADH